MYVVICIHKRNEFNYLLWKKKTSKIIFVLECQKHYFKNIYNYKKNRYTVSIFIINKYLDV